MNPNSGNFDTILLGAGNATINVASGVTGVQVFEQTVGIGTNGFDSLVLAGTAIVYSGQGVV